MIWFACKKCGKHHGKAENLCGTLVFCDCGFGNRVPWTSTVPEPESPPPEPAPRPRTPRPVPMEDDNRRPPPRRSIPVDDQDDWQPSILRTRARKEPKKINPNFCLVHDEKQSEHPCKDCGLRFCSSCVVTLQGDTVCGPCKNFRLRGTHRPKPVSPWAIGSVIAGLGCATLGFCASMWGINAQLTPGSGGASVMTMAMGVVGLIVPLIGLTCGVVALWKIEGTPNVSGRFFAMTGTAAGLIATLWSGAVGLLMIVKSV